MEDRLSRTLQAQVEADRRNLNSDVSDVLTAAIPQPTLNILAPQFPPLPQVVMQNRIEPLPDLSAFFRTIDDPTRKASVEQLNVLKK